MEVAAQATATSEIAGARHESITVANLARSAGPVQLEAETVGIEDVHVAA